jgi:hypothetical protein
MAEGRFCIPGAFMRGTTWWATLPSLSSEHIDEYSTVYRCGMPKVVIGLRWVDMSAGQGLLPVRQQLPVEYHR